MALKAAWKQYLWVGVAKKWRAHMALTAHGFTIPHSTDSLASFHRGISLIVMSDFYVNLSRIFKC